MDLNGNGGRGWKLEVRALGNKEIQISKKSEFCSMILNFFQRFAKNLKLSNL